MKLIKVATKIAKNRQNRHVAEFEMVDFEKNGAKSSLMVFLPTFVPKKIGKVFANVDFHVNPLFAALCCICI